MLPILSNAFLVAALVYAASGWFGNVPRWIHFLVALALALIPGSAAFYLTALLGQPSVTTLVLVGLFLYRQSTQHYPMPAQHRLELCLIVVSLALVLYPNALGLFAWDLYALGYTPVALSSLLCVLVTVAIACRRDVPAAIMTIAFVIYAAALFESDNLWDYLVDPLLVGYSLAIVISATTNHLRSRLLTD